MQVGANTGNHAAGTSDTFGVLDPLDQSRTVTLNQFDQTSTMTILDSHGNFRASVIVSLVDARILLVEQRETGIHATMVDFDEHAFTPRSARSIPDTKYFPSAAFPVATLPKRLNGDDALVATALFCKPFTLLTPSSLKPGGVDYPSNGTAITVLPSLGGFSNLEFVDGHIFGLVDSKKGQPWYEVAGAFWALQQLGMPIWMIDKNGNAVDVGAYILHLYQTSEEPSRIRVVAATTHDILDALIPLVT